MKTKRTFFLLFLFLLNPILAEKVRMEIDSFKEPLTCQKMDNQYFCEDGDDFIFGIAYGPTVVLKGSYNGTVSDYRATKIESLDKEGTVYFEGSENSYNPFFYGATNESTDTTYFQDLVSLRTFKHFLSTYEQNSEAQKFKNNFLAKVDKQIKTIHNKLESDEVNLELIDGEELACKRAPTLEESKIKCSLYTCSHDGKKYSYITHPNPDYGVSILLNVDNKGMPKQKVVISSSLPNEDKLINMSYFRPNVGGFGDGGGYGQGGFQGQGLGQNFGQGSYGDEFSSEYSQQNNFYHYEKPEFEYSDLIPKFDDQETTMAFNLMATGGESLVKDSLQGCSPESYKGILNSFDKIKEEVLSREYVQYVTDVNNGLVGYYLGLENLPSSACSEDGVYYNPEIYQTAREKEATSEAEVKTITPEKAQELFDMAKAMDDIAWGYKMDGCYARAHLMARRFEELGIEVDKAWLKGSLRAKGKDGAEDIQWNFHVAPIVYVKDEEGKVQKMVIDPSVEDKPVTAQQWAQNLSDDVEGRVQLTRFPYPENSGEMLRNSLAFSNSDPYLPIEDVNTSEEQKMSMADQTMFEYKGYENAPTNSFFGNTRN